MKKSYGIIMFCIFAILGILLLWKTPEKSVTASPPFPGKTAVPQQETDDFEDENEPESEEDVQLMKRLKEESLQVMKQFENLRKLTPAERRANETGAEAKITLHVTDSLGNSVEGATVIGFLYPKTESEAEIINGLTDKNGLFSISGKTRSFVEYVTEKEDYYPQKRGTHWVFSRKTKEPCFKDGRWVPWNPTIEVTLKEKRNPIPMYSKEASKELPNNEAMGFDFKAGDWVTPHGKGKYPDVTIIYTSNNDEWENMNNQLLITMKESEGFIQMPLDTFSLFESAYEAPSTGYEPNMKMELKRENHRTLTDIRVPEDHYLVFRTRVEAGGNGEILKANYGKIYRFIYGHSGTPSMGYVRFTYYFNPNENDRNLEHRGNLFER